MRRDGGDDQWRLAQPWATRRPAPGVNRGRITSRRSLDRGKSMITTVGMDASTKVSYDELVVAPTALLALGPSDP
jgi:hypothetical protein